MKKNCLHADFFLGAVPCAVGLACCPVAVLADELWPTAQLAPTAYTAAINSPTADVLPWGGAGLSLTNSNPERARQQPAGSFGSVNAGVGLLPGLELVGRLAYEGDLDCNMLLNSCSGGQRDLSLSAKYQLPIELPLDTRLALGFTDYGGAATSYRSYYGVATSTWGPLDLSLGYGKPKSAAALLDGGFGSVVLRLDDHWATALEHDSREARLGLNYTRALTRDLGFQLGVSRKLTDVSAQQPWQMSAALNIMLGRPVPEPLREARRSAESLEPVASGDKRALPVLPAAAPVVSSTPEAVALSLHQRGFSQIQVRYWPASGDQPALWKIDAEPRRWRQSQIDAMGQALASWLALQGKAADGSRPADELLLSLTWQREPVLHAYTSAACLDGWINGWSRCALGDQSDLAYGRALELHRELAGMGARLNRVKARLQQPAQTVSNIAGEPSWLPQFEIGPGLRYNLGTEVGLLDYSVALEVGTEVSLADLAPGLFWQGVLSAPLAHSDNYDDGAPFAGNRHPKLAFDSSLLSWWKPLTHGVAAQASAGYIDRRYKGGMVDAAWMNGDGRLRLSATTGSFEHDTTGLRQNPVLGSARWSLVPGAWQLEATVGRFLGGDTGYRLSSNHWFGDTQIKLYYRDSQGESATPQAAQHKFIGASINLPLGPKAAHALGPVTVRGTDRLALGLETKVAEVDNNLTYGYGETPRARHGVLSDVTDHDRNGQVDLLAQYRRLRAVMSEQLAVPR